MHFVQRGNAADNIYINSLILDQAIKNLTLVEFSI